MKPKVYTVFSTFCLLFIYLNFRLTNTKFGEDLNCDILSNIIISIRLIPYITIHNILVPKIKISFILVPNITIQKKLYPTSKYKTYWYQT